MTTRQILHSIFLGVAILLGCLGTLLANPLVHSVQANDTQGQYTQDGFKVWLKGFATRAQAYGISSDLLQKALTDAEFIPRVIDHDRNQPEFKLTFGQYIDRSVTAQRLSLGNEYWARHAALLNEIHQTYQVSPRYILAFWAMESTFGKHTGKYSLIASLATLSYDNRRSAFFEKQLLTALHLVDQGILEYEQLQGAWAGAMGALQFIPTSYLSYAVDRDGDGKKDLWNSLPDIFASASNYLRENGWEANGRWVWLSISLPSSPIQQPHRRHHET